MSREEDVERLLILRLRFKRIKEMRDKYDDFLIRQRLMKLHYKVLVEYNAMLDKLKSERAEMETENPGAEKLRSAG